MPMIWLPPDYKTRDLIVFSWDMLISGFNWAYFIFHLDSRLFAKMTKATFGAMLLSGLWHVATTPKLSPISLFQVKDKQRHKGIMKTLEKDI
jgi:hypothetical protein